MPKFSTKSQLEYVDEKNVDQQELTSVIEILKNEIYPVGTTYIQFPGDPSPATLNLVGTWQNKSSELAGDFIRFEGGDASVFESGEVAEGLPNITGSLYVARADFGGVNSMFSTVSGALSLTLNQTPTAAKRITGTTSSTNQDILNVNAQNSNAIYGASSHVTPINRTVRKWRRTA